MVRSVNTFREAWSDYNLRSTTIGIIRGRYTQGEGGIWNTHFRAVKQSRSLCGFSLTDVRNNIACFQSGSQSRNRFNILTLLSPRSTYLLL